MPRLNTPGLEGHEPADESPQVQARPGADQQADSGQQAPQSASTVVVGRAVRLRLPVVQVRFSTRQLVVTADQLPRVVVSSAGRTMVGASRAAAAAAHAGAWVARRTRSRRPDTPEPEKQQLADRRTGDDKRPSTADDQPQTGTDTTTSV